MPTPFAHDSSANPAIQKVYKHFVLLADSFDQQDNHMLKQHSSNTIVFANNMLQFSTP